MKGSLEDVPKSYLLYSYKLYDGKSMEIDTDNDGLVDGVENLLGLNYKEKDSDGDGLDDYFEYSLCGLNPLENFNGSFVPFVTLMEFDVPFESDIIMFKPGK